TRALGRFPHHRTLIVGTVALAIVAEGWWVCPLVRVPPPIQPGLVGHDALAIDLPLSTAVHLNTIAQYSGVMRGYRTVNGYSGYLTEHFIEATRLAAQQDSRLFDTYRKLAYVYVIVRPGRERNQEWVESQPGVEHVATILEGDV